MPKTKKSKSSAKKVVSTTFIIDQYIRSQEIKATEARLHREVRAEDILIQEKIKQQEALMKFRRYNGMTLDELENVYFEDTTTTKRIRKNRSKTAEVIKVVPFASRRRPSRSATRPQTDETPTKPPRSARIGELILSIQGSPLLVNRVIPTPLSVKEKKVMGQIRILRNNLNKLLSDHN